jgi:hypothetical protein
MKIFVQLSALASLWQNKDLCYLLIQFSGKNNK